MDGSCSKGSSVTDTELTVRVNTEIIHNALILWHTLPLDGCVFACEKSAIMSARAPPCRILKLNNCFLKFKEEYIVKNAGIKKNLKNSKNFFEYAIRLRIRLINCCQQAGKEVGR